MAFNSNTYHANKSRREAWKALAEAREIRARIAAGVAYDWEASQVRICVMRARGAMHRHLLFRSL